MKKAVRRTLVSVAAYVAVALVVILAFASRGSDACAPDVSHWLDVNNRSMECIHGTFRFARPSVVGQPCKIANDVTRDACGQTLFCDSRGSWAETLGNRVCIR